MDSERDCDLAKEHPEKFKIAEGSQVYERAGIGDDQGCYPALRILANSSRALASESQSSAV